MIVEQALRAIMALGDVFKGVASAGWTVVDYTPLGPAMTWFLRLDAWVPATELLTLIGIISTFGTFAIGWRLFVLLVSWVRG